MQKFSADFIFPISSEPVKNGVVIADAAGKILAVEPPERHDPVTVQKFQGVIVPGFVNAHCHLELSHMRGKVDTGTGLIPFITNVVTKRAAAPEVIQDAIQRAEQEMFDGGIVAVGDISNVPDTFGVKVRGRLRYYTFIEMFDFLQEEDAGEVFAKYKAVYDQLALAPGSRKSATPHAPYSVSKNLFRRIADFQPEADHAVSIHNQETPPEDELFEKGSGAFFDFYGKFGISLESFQKTGKPSIYYALAHMNPTQRSLFVHNTLTCRADIEAAHAWSPNVFWVTCPNANLYIENRLPWYRHFLDTSARVAIGTDSLTSNWQLSVLEEMKTIARFQSYVPFETLLRWATLNGALALGFADTLGSIEVGKTPGLNLLNLRKSGGGWKLEEKTRVRRLI